MNCELEHCIYNRDFKCLLDKININVLGMCEEYSIISLGKDFLDAEKERQLQEIVVRQA